MTADVLVARQVEAMAGYGLPAKDIAIVLGIDAWVLERDYRTELQAGAIKANAKVAESLFRRATGEGREGVTAAIFWLKTRAGWKETQAHEVQSEVRYIARMPEPCGTVEEWLDRYSPHRAAALAGGTEAKPREWHDRTAARFRPVKFDGPTADW